MAGVVHEQIVAAAVRWLQRNGCAAILADPFKAGCTEQPDAIGWRDGVSLTVEVKASRSDFLADAKKPHRIDVARAVGDWRFYAAPVSVIRPADLPDGWGLLEWDGKSLKPAHGAKGQLQLAQLPVRGQDKQARGNPTAGFSNTPAELRPAPRHQAASRHPLRSVGEAFGRSSKRDFQ